MHSMLTLITYIFSIDMYLVNNTLSLTDNEEYQIYAIKNF